MMSTEAYQQTSSCRGRSWARGLFIAFLLLCCLTNCRRRSDIAKEATLTIYGFSVVREPLENEIVPAFVNDWEKKTGQKLNFTLSFAGSEMVTNQIVSGVEADLAILAMERNAQRLFDEKATKSHWHWLPHGGVINKTPMVILVRKGNPKRIRDFADLAKPGVRLIYPDPTASGAGQWSLLAIYGAELLKSERRTGVRDKKAALEQLKQIWRNVIATPDSARAARTQLERGEGDALITYELEALQLLDKQLPFEVVTPSSTIFCEHVVVIVDHGMPPAKYALVELFARSLWEGQAQHAWVKYHFRSINFEEMNDENPRFVKIAFPFTVADLGSWKQAYPEIIEGVWKQQVLATK
jgi:sulfate/thiosulfate transport system substrate-binding protein